MRVAGRGSFAKTEPPLTVTCTAGSSTGDGRAEHRVLTRTGSRLAKNSWFKQQECVSLLGTLLYGSTSPALQGIIVRSRGSDCVETGSQVLIHLEDPVLLLFVAQRRGSGIHTPPPPFSLSTKLKVVAIDGGLDVVHQDNVQFDSELPEFR